LIQPQELTKNRIVVDTDVFSYILAERPQADFFRPYFLHRTLAVSFVTVGQVYFGAFKNNWGANRISRLEKQLKNYVVLPYDYDVCLAWAHLRADCELDGFRVPDLDAWIAACALRHDCALATNNGSHFLQIKGLIVICPTIPQGQF
jgi:predicted nucleic acid-binding protein